MGDGLRTVRVVSTDESLVANARAACEALEGWEVDAVDTVEALQARPPVAGDIILLDAWLRGENVYETCRRLTGTLRCRMFVVTGVGNRLAEPIARFSGATGVLERPITRTALSEALGASTGPRPSLPSQQRSDAPAPAPAPGAAPASSRELPEALLVDIRSGERDQRLASAVCDPETGLFNYGFLNFKLDEEFKRAKRFGHPLSCVMLGFEGQADEATLRELAGIFLSASRDTDVLGRFDESSFLFLLPNTGPDGARVMAERVREQAEAQGLRDLVGDPMDLSVGIHSCPHPAIRRKEDLFAATRDAYTTAVATGAGVVTAG